MSEIAISSYRLPNKEAPGFAPRALLFRSPADQRPVETSIVLPSTSVT